MQAADLAARYGVNLNSLNARIRYLGLKAPITDPDDLAMLDALNDHLKEGNPITAFSYTPAATVEVITESGLTLQRSPLPATIPDLDDLDRIYGFLQKAADQGWHLPSSVIRSLTGANPKGNRWKRYGFEFTPATRHGGEKAWAVSQASWDFPIG